MLLSGTPLGRFPTFSGAALTQCLLLSGTPLGRFPTFSGAALTQCLILYPLELFFENGVL